MDEDQPSREGMALMAKARLLSRSLGASRKFAATAAAGRLREFSQLLFTLLIPHTDDFGRMAGDAFTLKHAVFPSSPRRVADFEKAIQSLRDSGLVILYTVDDHIYLQVVDFERHQGNLHKRTTSLFPEPPGTSGNFPEASGTSGNFSVETKRNELKRNEPKREPSAPSALTPPPLRIERKRPATLVQRRILNAAYEWRASVMTSQHQGFLRKLGGNPPDAERRLFAFYRRVADDWGEDTPIGDNDFKFWDLRFEEWVGSTRRVGETAQTDAAGEAWVKRKAADLAAKEGLR